MDSHSDLSPIPLVDLQTQSRALKEEVLRRMGDVIDGARYILGQEVQEFEESSQSTAESITALGWLTVPKHYTWRFVLWISVLEMKL